MAFKIIVRKRAEQNISEAFYWYEMKQKSLGYDFLENIQVQIRNIQNAPLLYQIRHKNIRCALVPRFPYGIFYLIENDKIIILAVLHFSRDPSFWKI